MGSNSLLNELELVQIIDEVFRRLSVNVLVKINNRKILSGIAEVIGHPDKLTDITVAIDKLDKIGQEKVNAELADRGLDANAIENLQPILSLNGSTEQKLDVIANVLASSETGCKGVRNNFV